MTRYRVIKKDKHFPAELIESCLNSFLLQLLHSTRKAKARYLEEARYFDCGTPKSELKWFFFQTPRSAWKQRRGREGWMTCCPKCQRQIDFFVTALN